jgi:uroporphyrinogen-III decarboxylase
MSAFALEIPDKVPFHAYESPENALRRMGICAHEMYLDKDILPAAMINSAKLYQNDIIYMRPGLEAGVDEKIVREGDGLAFFDKQTGRQTFRVLHDQKTKIPLSKSRPLVETERDVEKMTVTPWRELLQKTGYSSLARYVEEFKGKRFLFGFACNQSANELATQMGLEESMLATMTDTGLCRAILDRRFEQLKEEMQALCHLGCDGVYTGDATASCSLFSPETYRELFFDYHKKSIAYAHGLGMKALLHICGRISPILEDMAATGADVLESIDRHCSGGDMTLRDAKQRVGDRVCLKGNLDAVHEIEPGPPEKIYELCLQAMRDAGPGGYVLSTEQITRDTPPEHVLAMVQARDDFKP